MEYIIHVIDEACHYLRNDDGKFELSEGKSSDKKKYGLAIRYDSFYFTEGDSPTDAVMGVADLIKMKDGNGDEILLSKMLEESSKEKDKEILKLGIHDIQPIDRATSTSFSSSCRILHKAKTEDQEGTEETTEEKNISKVELHEFCFYVIPKNKIVCINKDTDKDDKKEKIVEESQPESQPEEEEAAK